MFQRWWRSACSALAAVSAVAFAAVCISLPAVAQAAGVSNAQNAQNAIEGDELYPQELAGETIDEAVRAYLAELLAAGGEKRRCVLDATHVMRDVRVPAGEISLQVLVPNGVRYWGNTITYVQIYANGVPFRRLTAHYRLHVYDEIVVAARAISMGQTLTAADFRTEEQEVGAHGANYVSDATAFYGMEARRRFSPGQPVLKNMVRKPLVIAQGDTVKIRVNRNGVVVEIDGVALEAGRQDAIIRVRNAKSRKVLRARVVDAGTVEVLQ